MKAARSSASLGEGACALAGLIPNSSAQKLRHKPNFFIMGGAVNRINGSAPDHSCSVPAGLHRPFEQRSQLPDRKPKRPNGRCLKRLLTNNADLKLLAPNP